MVWADEKNELLYRETLFSKPYKFKARIKKHGHVWKIIADNLNMADENFLIDERAVRERFTLIAEQKKIKEQERLVGLHPLI